MAAVALSFLMILLVSAGVLLLVPVLVLLIETVAAMVPPRQHDEQDDAAGKIAVLIPAHDEAQSIVSTISRILPQLGASDRLIVIADNCTDDTARIAKEAGATVIERFDATRH